MQPSSGEYYMSAVGTTEYNKQLVKKLFNIIFGTSLEAIEGIDDLVAEDYIQHNPRAEQGREGLRNFCNVIIQNPEIDPADTQSVTFIAEGNMVVRQEMRANGMLIDIFRVQDGKLQEHWDAFRFAPGAKIIPGF
jgi:predicted SnoaL-like aldol condensation-catalyzing enzyme